MIVASLALKIIGIHQERAARPLTPLGTFNKSPVRKIGPRFIDLRRLE